MTPARRPSILIIEQGFLKPRRGKPVHGVELFRLHLIRQLAEHDVAVTLVAEQSWERHFRERLAGAPVEFVYAARAGGVPLAGLAGTIRAARAHRASGPFDLALFGNARLGMVPAMFWASWFGVARRYLMFAHRNPGPKFLDVVSSVDFDVLANSEWVARGYRGHVSGRVTVRYGLPNADWFYPAAPKPATDPDRPINFVLLGKLPHPHKGMDAAIEAFRRLPPRLRERSRLHLAAFPKPPQFDDPNIIAHSWMPADAVPEFLRSMDVMLTLSTLETFSQAIVQGMLTELPIIASDIPVYVEKLDPARGGGGGFITTSTAQVTDAMVRLIEDPALRASLGATGRRVALDRYVWDTRWFMEQYFGAAGPAAQSAQ